MYIPRVPDGVALRPVEPGDADLLLLIYSEARREELDQVAWPPRARDAFLRQQFHAQSAHYSQHYPGAEFLVIEIAGSPAGRLYVWRAPEEIRIIDIALLPEARGCGVGGALMRGLLDEARATGRRAVIHAEKNNRALNLYFRLGFTVVEDKGVYWKLEWRPIS